MEDLRPETEEMEVFEESDFLDEGNVDTNDDDSEKNEDETDEIDETNDDNADQDDIDDEDVKDEANKDEEEEDTTPKPFKFKGKLNHQDIEEDIPYEEAVALIQMGKDYDRVKDQVSTYKNDPRLSFVENLAKKHNMSPEQYIQAVHDQEDQDEIDELIRLGTNADIAKEVVETRKQKRQESQAQSHSQKQEEKELVEFVEYYAKINGKPFDPDSDTLPNEVWKSNAGGTPLKVAYMEHLVQQKQELQKEAQKQADLKKQNEEAKKKAPVKGVSNGGFGKSPKKDPQLVGLFED